MTSSHYLYHHRGMHLKDLAKTKRNTMQIYGTPERYDTYKRTREAADRLYTHDYLHYNDSVAQRHARNKEQIKKLIQALKNKQISTDMLEYNTCNAFYASYVLNHHINSFTELVAEMSVDYPQLNALLPKLYDFTALGGIFERVVDVGFKKEGRVGLHDGVLVMPADSFFYSFKTSPYLHVCCFELKQNGKNYYVFVQLRDQNGELLNEIETQDLGATISPDYLCIGYRFNNVKPMFVIESSSAKLYRDVVSNDAVTELGYSIQDLTHSLHVTVKYTGMRVQFATLEKNKHERPILQYQAVTSRIADGFAALYGLSFLRQKLLAMPQVSSLMRFYLPYMHQVVLKRLIELRECCGGFGFLQVSGHPGFIERVSLRAAQPASTAIPDNPEIMKRLHYYSSDLGREEAYLKQISQKGDRIEDIFFYFIIICMNMRKQRQLMSPRTYMKQFLKQSCIQMMYSSTYFDPADPTNPTDNIIPYIIISYVIQNAKYMNWGFLKKQHEHFHETLLRKKTQLLESISSDVPRLTAMLEVGGLRNVIIGGESEQFYTTVFEAAKKNRRNSPEYSDYVLKSLVGLIKEQRAKL